MSFFFIFFIFYDSIIFNYTSCIWISIVIFIIVILSMKLNHSIIMNKIECWILIMLYISSYWAMFRINSWSDRKYVTHIADFWKLEKNHFLVFLLSYIGESNLYANYSRSLKKHFCDRHNHIYIYCWKWKNIYVQTQRNSTSLFFLLFIFLF